MVVKPVSCGICSTTADEPQVVNYSKASCNVSTRGCPVGIYIVGLH